MPTARLHEIFGADAKLVDLRPNATLWVGHASASSAEQNNSGGGGIAGMLITAVVKQVIGTASHAGFTYAAVADQRLRAPFFVWRNAQRVQWRGEAGQTVAG